MNEELGANMPPIQTQTPLVGVNTVAPAPSSVDPGPAPDDMQPDPVPVNPVAEAFAEDTKIKEEQAAAEQELNQEPDPDAQQPDTAADVGVLNQIGEAVASPIDTFKAGVGMASEAVGLKPAEFTAGYRAFTDVGSVDKMPVEAHVQNLRIHQNDPEAVAAFDELYGEGSAKRYLSLPSESHMFNLWLYRNDLEAVKAFDQLYGGTSSLALRLMDPARSAQSKWLDKDAMITMLATGKDLTGRTGYAQETISAVGTGAARGTQELLRSALSLGDWLAGEGSNVSKQLDFKAGSNIGTNLPVINDMLTGVTQFLTGRAAVGGKVGGFTKELGIGAIVDAFAFNPDDPNIGDLLKGLGLPAYTAADFDSEMAKRALNAGYGAAAGLAVAGLFKAFMYGKAALKGGTEGAAHAVKAREALEEARKAVEDNAQTLAEVRKSLEDVKKSIGDTMKAVDGSTPVKAPEVPGTAKPAVQAPEALPERPLTIRPERKAVTSADVKEMPTKDAVKAIVTDTPPGAVAFDNAAAKASGPAIPNSVVRILNEMPEFSTMTIKQMDEAVSAVFDRWLGVANKSVGDILDVLDMPQYADYIPKVQQLAIATYRRGVEEVANTSAALKLAKEATVTNAARIDELDKALTEATASLEKYAKVNTAASRFAGRTLAIRNTADNVRAALRTEIDEAIKAGRTPEEIGEMTERVLKTLNTERLEKLYAKRAKLEESIPKLNNLDQIARQQAELDSVIKNIASEEAVLGKEAITSARTGLGKLDSFGKQLLKDGITLTSTNMLGGIGTTLRNITGGAIHRIAQNASLLFGEVTKELKFANLTDPAKIFGGMADGIKAYRLLREARNYGLRGGQDSMLLTFKDALTDAAGTALRGGQSHTGTRGVAENVHRIQGAKYGLEEGALKTTVDVFGHAVNLQTFAMRFSDEVMSNIFNLTARAEYAGVEFLERVAREADTIKAKLRDPSLSTKAREGLTERLQTLKGDGATVKLANGDELDLKAFVDKSIKESRDNAGRWIHEKSAEAAEYTLLKNDLPGVWGQIERGINAVPAARIIVPFFRSPVQGFLRGFEFIPGVRNIPLLSNFRNELKSADPLIAARARGKMFLGYGIMLGIWQLYEKGFTGDFVASYERQKRQAQQAAGGLQSGYVGVGNFAFDTTGLDPLSIPFAFIGSLHRSYKAYEQRQLIEKERQAVGKANAGDIGEIASHEENFYGAMLAAAAAAIGVSAVNNPAFTGLKDLTDIAGSAFGQGQGNVLKDDASRSKAAARILRNQIGKLVPALYKNLRDANDMQLYEQTYLLRDVWEAFENEMAFNRTEMSMKYDAMGFPIQRATLPRGLVGPFNRVQPTTDNPKVAEVRKALYDLGKITGNGFAVFNDSVPDKLVKASGVDLRRMDSVNQRHVIDTFASELQKTGLLDALYTELITNKSTLANRGFTTGGPIKSARVEAVKKLITKAREEAWIATLKKEGLLESGTGVVPGGNVLLQTERSYGAAAIARDAQANQ